MGKKRKVGFLGHGLVNFELESFSRERRRKKEGGRKAKTKEKKLPKAKEIKKKKH